jgi:hypothetical protein
MIPRRRRMEWKESMSEEVAGGEKLLELSKSSHPEVL